MNAADDEGRSMKILLLGNSDTDGSFLDAPLWPEVVREALELRQAGSVSWVAERFSASASTGIEHAQVLVRKHQPDLVIVPVVTFAMSVGFVWVRIRDLFGERAGRRWRRLEERFDAGTRKKGGIVGAANRAARAVTRTVVGTRPITSPPELTRRYVNLVHQLSQIEETQAALITYPGTGKWASRGRMPAERAKLFAAVHRAADEHHFTWIDVAAAADEAGAGPELYKADGYHLSAAGHAFMARAVLSALEEPAAAGTRVGTVTEP